MDLKDDIAGVLNKDVDVLLAIVFGSQAEGKSSPQSDVDVAIATKEPLDLDKKIQIAERLRKKLNKEIDLVDLRTAEGVILTQILTKGVTVINKDYSLKANLIKKMWYYQEDYKPLYKKMLSARRKRFFNG